MFKTIITTLSTALFSSYIMAAGTIIPAPPELASSSYILVDAKSGEVLVEYNADLAVPPASLTKMMTSYVAERELATGNLTLEEETTVSEKAWKMVGSRMFIQEGKQVSIGDLMRGIIIHSGNDASVAMAEHIAGTEDTFVSMMNQYAAQIGMLNTQYKNATGLPEDGHYSSARDLALLANRIIADHPEYYSWYAEKEFTYNNITQSNRNKLLFSNPDVDGLKTGHTDEAGYCLVASAVKDDMRLIAVVMGTKSESLRAQETQKLLAWGFRFYKTHTIHEAFDTLQSVKIWKGDQDQIGLGLDNNIVVTIPRGSVDDIKTTLEFDKNLQAPINNGDVLGRIIIEQEGEILLERPLVALETVEKGSFFKRLWDAIQLFFINLFE